MAFMATIDQYIVSCESENKDVRSSINIIDRKGNDVMKKNDVFWDYFTATGNLGAYLLSREMNKKGKEVWLRKKTK